MIKAQSYEEICQHLYHIIPKESWSFDKLDFITCYSECLSIFNNNFKEDKK